MSNYDGPALADALHRAHHRTARDEALLRQALGALELTQEGSEFACYLPEAWSHAAAKDYAQMWRAIAALRERLGEKA